MDAAHAQDPGERHLTPGQYRTIGTALVLMCITAGLVNLLHIWQAIEVMGLVGLALYARQASAALFFSFHLIGTFIAGYLPGKRFKRLVIAIVIALVFTNLFEGLSVFQGRFGISQGADLAQKSKLAQIAQLDAQIETKKATALAYSNNSETQAAFFSRKSVDASARSADRAAATSNEMEGLIKKRAELAKDLKPTEIGIWGEFWMRLKAIFESVLLQSIQIVCAWGAGIMFRSAAEAQEVLDAEQRAKDAAHVPGALERAVGWLLGSKGNINYSAPTSKIPQINMPKVGRGAALGLTPAAAMASGGGQQHEAPPAPLFENPPAVAAQHTQPNRAQNVPGVPATAPVAAPTNVPDAPNPAPVVEPENVPVQQAAPAQNVPDVPKKQATGAKKRVRQVQMGEESTDSTKRTRVTGLTQDEYVQCKAGVESEQVKATVQALQDTYGIGQDKAKAALQKMHNDGLLARKPSGRYVLAKSALEAA